ncbi:MAG TPA: hypothetical protein VFK88_01845 [Gallionella sp.]|nr:hypothetical protein [Gallionella sp.]
MAYNQSSCLKPAFVIFAAQLALCSPSAFAWCADHPTVAEEFGRSAVVLVAKVVAEEKVIASGDYVDGINYRLSVSEVLRGEQKKSLTLFSEDSSGRFPMKVGESYLVFASAEQGLLPGQPAFTVNNCGNSGLLSESQPKLQEVRRLAKR